MDTAAAQKMLEQQLRTQLEGQLGEQGEIMDEQFSSRVTGGVLEVCLQAACREEIGKQVLRSETRQDSVAPKV